jgi:bifunctional non-homologous end joining protein LigD
VLDGEAILLGVDGISDFDGLVSRQHDEEVHYAFDILALEQRPVENVDAGRAMICGNCRCTYERTTSPAYWPAGRTWHFRQRLPRSGTFPEGLREGIVSKHRDRPLQNRNGATLGEGEEPNHPAMNIVKEANRLMSARS